MMGRVVAISNGSGNLFEDTRVCHGFGHGLAGTTPCAAGISFRAAVFLPS
jgi:hypothetical protein